MRIIPVMDLMGGQVVHAVGGRRTEYRPIRSRLVDSSAPDLIAAAFRDRLRLSELYIADLDAIAGAEPAWDLYRKLTHMGLDLIVDLGIRSPSMVRGLADVGVTDVVVGLESCAGPGALRDIAMAATGSDLWFSLDLRNGEPITQPGAWSNPSPQGIVGEVVSLGLTRIIVLDLARVGEGRGLGTEALCPQLLNSFPQLTLLAGGGVRDHDDLDRLAKIGVSGALVATALHELQLP